MSNGFYTTSSFNLGTTTISVNRASANQTLTGISIDGSAASCTGDAAGSVPVGGIIMWSGATAPTGWQLCNFSLIESGLLGGQYTPNLTDRFIIGAGAVYPVGTTGGSADAVVVSHTHPITDPGHSHTVSNVCTYQGDISDQPGGLQNHANTPSLGTSSKTTGISINSSGESGTNKNLPPYYALAYIMRIA